jgi:DNA-binding response OmpR family regulator
MQLLLLTADPRPGSVLPALSLLAHSMRSAAPELATLPDVGLYDAVFVDARWDLAGSRGLCRSLASTGLDVAVVVVIGEGGLVALSAEWACDEILLPTTGPAELDARLRLLAAHRSAQHQRAGRNSALMLDELVIDEATYTVRLRDRPLDFTYMEFELLKYLAQHAGRVFTRTQLLQEVWGYDFFGGTRTVDVHVRRLRAKLGPEHEQLIGTVRNVGYKFVRPQRSMSSRERAAQEHAAEHDAETADTDADPRSGGTAAGHRIDEPGPPRGWLFAPNADRPPLDSSASAAARC